MSREILPLFHNANQMSAFELDAETLAKNLSSDPTFVVEGFLWGLCNQGSIDYQLNHDSRRLAPSTSFFIAPKQMLTLLKHTPDVRLILIHIPLKIMEQLHDYTNTLPQNAMPFRESLHHADNLLTQDHPLPEELCQEERQLFSLLKKYLYPQCAQSDMAVAAPLLQSMLMIAVKALNHKPQTYRTLTRQEKLTKDFFALLMKHHKERHEVAFYASELCVSSKYLSGVVKQSTEHSPQEWINRAIVYTAKRMLKTENLSVSQVADRLYFSCSSSFVRFFRIHTGETPRGFLYKNVNCEL